MSDVEEKKATQNAISKKVPQMKKAGEDTTEIFKEMKELSDKIKVLDDEVREIDAQLRDFMLRIPNIKKRVRQIICKINNLGVVCSMKCGFGFNYMYISKSRAVVQKVH